MTCELACKNVVKTRCASQLSISICACWKRRSEVCVLVLYCDRPQESQRYSIRGGEWREEVSTELKRIQQYAVDVTLDPDTAHLYLILSDDGKQVTCGDTKQNLPDTLKRFTYHPIVLRNQGFSSGRFYYEVQVSRKTMWSLGVVRESVNRKGKIETFKPQDGFWTVILRKGNEYTARDDPCISLSLREKPQKVGVFVDYDEGLVSFYDVEARSHIYSFTGQSFTEKRYPYFSPCLNDGGKNAAPLIISRVSKTE
ncbi:E3 ubiquitin-protein ligase TRIM39-like [Ictalurus furcatus]|uniref:E3 ubiquitin-protein ligase TRIM39-like n=1 Tax=Ictalurus furcatus TaxID=66913 RepID=UPI0023501725|nr:E3 ubiquitin-protein ligase TRIM39-like [Ictalurus furcatus]